MQCAGTPIDLPELPVIARHAASSHPVQTPAHTVHTGCSRRRLSRPLSAAISLSRAFASVGRCLTCWTGRWRGGSGGVGVSVVSVTELGVWNGTWGRVGVFGVTGDTEGSPGELLSPAGAAAADLQ